MKSPLPFWLLFIVWLPTTLLTLTSVFIFQGYLSKTSQKNSSVYVLAQDKISYQAFASFPKSLPDTSFSITTQDAIPELIKTYLKKHHSPMAETADFLIASARNSGLDPLLLVAIAQCESNLGKKMPEDCHNPFGWGIHSAGTLCFDSWEEGYEKVAQGLKNQYVKQGLVTPDEIMTKYNYDSWQEREGSWAKCVSLFLEDLQTANLANKDSKEAILGEETEQTYNNIEE